MRMEAVDELVGEHRVQLANGGVLVEPVVADEDTTAMGASTRRVTVAVAARDGPELVGSVVVVADEVAESRLLVSPVVRPLGALGVVNTGRAVLPVVEELLSTVALLRDNEAGVPQDPVFLITVTLGVGILGHGQEGLGLDVPEAQEPLEGQVHLLENGVGIEEDDDIVLLERFSDDGDLDPGAPSILVIRGSD